MRKEEKGSPKAEVATSGKEGGERGEEDDKNVEGSVDASGIGKGG